MPKYLILITFIAIAFFQNANAQDKAIESVETAVLQLKDAMLSGEEARLLAISSKDLTYGHSNGVIEDQDAFVYALASGNNNFTSITLSDQTVEVLGKIALVRHNLTGTTHNKGAEPSSVNLGVLTVWQKKGKAWKLLARQAYKR